MIWILTLYIIPVIIGIGYITHEYKVDCKRKSEIATIGGLLEYDLIPVAMCLTPIINIFFSLAAMFILLVELIKDIKI